MRALAWLGIALAASAAGAGEWSVRRIGINLFQVTGQPLLVRTEDCDDRPDTGLAVLKKDAGTTVLAFIEPASVKCTVRDALMPTRLEEGRYMARLTLDQAQNWYQITDSEVYLNTAGCFSRAFTEMAELTVLGDGSGRLRFVDGRACSVARAYRRVNP